MQTVQDALLVLTHPRLTAGEREQPTCWLPEERPQKGRRRKEDNDYVSMHSETGAS